MSEFNIEDLDAVISEAKSSLVQMLALQLQKELKNVADLEGKNSLLQSKLDLINGLMDATKPAIEIVEQGVSELQSQNAELAVQIANDESKCRELESDNEKAMESLKQADAAVKLAHKKFSALAAENSALKNPDNWLSQSDYGYEAAEVATQNGATEDESLRAGMLAIINRIETPATDAFLAEMQAQAVEMAIGHIEQTICQNHETILNEFAAQLRKGDKS